MSRNSRTLTRVTCLAAVVCPALTAVVSAQRFGQRGGRRGGDRFFGPRMAAATPLDFDGSFHFCRLAYQRGNWATDWPAADYNFSIRLSELTKTWVGKDEAGEVLPLIVRPTDETLFQCPFTMLWQAERLWFSDADAAQMREYLLKGGFLWSDDSWGTYAWENFAAEIAKVLPPPKYRFIDIPDNHAILHTLYDVARVPQIPSINFWQGSGGRTSEQGADSAEVHFRGIFDEHGRLMVLSTHNTDIADGWEREGEDPRYFYRFSVDSYAVAIDSLLYVMSH